MMRFLLSPFHLTNLSLEKQIWSPPTLERRDRMKPALEDIFMGQLASPSFSEGFRWEDSRRRVRVVFADVTIADSKRVMLLHEFGRLPVFYFPMEDVRMDLMEETDHHTSPPPTGGASDRTIRR